MGASGKRDPREIPDYRLARTELKQRVIGVAVAIEIRHIYYIPASRKSRTEGAASKNVVVHVPHRRLYHTAVWRVPPL